MLEVGLLTFVVLAWFSKTLRLHAALAFSLYAAIHPLVVLVLAILVGAGIFIRSRIS